MNFMKNFLNRRAIKQLISDKNTIKLNLGCGANIKSDWINIDSGEQFGEDSLDLVYDLSKGLPFPDESVDFIYHEHLIEHLSKEEGKVFLRDCLRILKEGGIMRIACPDLKMIIRDYQGDKFMEREWLNRIAVSYQGKSKCELFNICMRDWGHKYIYDIEEISMILDELNCVSIKECEVGVSKFSELNGMETREDSLVVEVEK